MDKESLPRRKLALFSVNELKDIVEFGRVLINNGWDIIATDSSYNLLREKGIPVMSVAAFVGYPERYKFPPTLHPKIEAALTDDSFSERIELVYDVTYGPEDSLDIGGNTLLALAVKGKRIPVASQTTMKSVVGAISKFGDISAAMRDILISDTIRKISDYYIQITESIVKEESRYLRIKLCYDLLNGENPYQKAALWALEGNDSLALTNYRLISDTKPCYTNMADLDSITETMTKLACAFRLRYNKLPYITVAAKHGNACGIGVDWESKNISIEKALWGNPMAIWGGEVVINFKLGTEESLNLLSSKNRERLFGKVHWMLDVIAAPEIDDKAYSFLTNRKNTKLFVNKSLLEPTLPTEAWNYRFTRGGVIRQSIADYVLDVSSISWNITEYLPENFDDILIAWVVAFTSFHGGNEIALAHKRQLISCAGGPSTVDAARTVVTRAIKMHGQLYDVSFAADAFFPFTDAPLILADSGVVCGVVPAGGLNHKQVQDFFTKRNIKVGFIPEKFRGFCRH